MKEDKYKDQNGYWRWNNSNRLVHRWVAEKYVYEKEKEKYPLPFEDYQVHHIDGNKSNNDQSNLKITTRSEHEKEHGLERIEWDVIRVLVVLLIIFGGVIPWLAIFSNILKISTNLRIILYFLVIVIGFATIIYITRIKKGIRKLY